jgi:hypothetical protein
MTTRYWLLLLPLAAAYGQTAQDFGASVRAAMEPSILKQRDSAKKQAAAISKKAVDSAEASFFTVPFTTQPLVASEQEEEAAIELEEPPREDPVPKVPAVTSMLDFLDLKEEAGTGTWLLKVLGAFNSKPAGTADQDYKPPKIIEVAR